MEEVSKPINEHRDHEDQPPESGDEIGNNNADCMQGKQDGDPTDRKIARAGLQRAELQVSARRVCAVNSCSSHLGSAA